VEVAQDAVVVTAVKLADDGSGDVVVRFHESRGGRTKATLTAGFGVGDVTVTDLLERPLTDAATPRRDGDRVTLSLRPFELVTLRLTRA
jgi:alpha-mannosidase